MPSDKDRLYVALFAREGKPKMQGRADTYHWALVIGPKQEAQDGDVSVRFHAKQTMMRPDPDSPPESVWVYEETPLAQCTNQMLLARIVVGKIKDRQRLQGIFGKVPLRPDTEGWNCIGWAKEAFETAVTDEKALGTRVSDWSSVMNLAMKYVGDKRAKRRFDGRGGYDVKRLPTWDMLQERELVE